MAGFIQPRPPRKASNTLVGLPFRRHESHESAPRPEMTTPPLLDFHLGDLLKMTTPMPLDFHLAASVVPQTTPKFDFLAAIRNAVHKSSTSRIAAAKASSTESKRSTSAIPWHLITTGKEASLGALPESVRGNIEHTLSLNKGMTMRYFSDDDCHKYIEKHFDVELATIYKKEPAGHFRGDICRAAILFREGGFYTDVDLEVKLSFKDMVDSATDFMSVFTADGHILNAMIATVPGNAVMENTLREVRRWYKGTEGDKTVEEHGEGEWMGTVTLRRGMEEFMKANCPDVQLENIRNEKKLQWSCGKHVIRFYQEDRLDCGIDPSEECPEPRFSSMFDGLKYGIFVPESRTVVAWPRVSTCTDWWCGGR